MGCKDMFSTKTLLRFLLRISDAAFVFLKYAYSCMEIVLESTCFVHIFRKAGPNSGPRARTLRCCVTLGSCLMPLNFSFHIWKPFETWGRE